MEAVLCGKQLGDDMTHPVLRVKLQGPSKRGLNNTGVFVDVFDRITTPREQGEVLKEGERVDEVDNP